MSRPPRSLPVRLTPMSPARSSSRPSSLHPVRDRDPAVSLLVPGADAMAASSNPEATVVEWVRRAGFDGLTCFTDADAGTPKGPDMWCTWGGSWGARWRSRGYATVDPRIVATAHQTLPCLWDGGWIVGRGALSRFLVDAARVGIASGVAVTLRSGLGRSVVAFDSSITPVDTRRQDAIVAVLRDLLWIAHAVHAWRHLRIASGARLRPSLTERERDCLSMSARGLTSRDIGVKLGITGRTVDFHVHKVLGKLGALNRHEAIAKAAARGWL